MMKGKTVGLTYTLVKQQQEDEEKGHRVTITTLICTFFPKKTTTLFLLNTSFFKPKIVGGSARMLTIMYTRLLTVLCVGNDKERNCVF